MWNQFDFPQVDYIWRFDHHVFMWNLDGGDLAIGLQNGTVCIFNVLGNGDFNLRTDGTSQV